VHRSNARGKILSALAEASEPMSPQDIAFSTGMSPNNVSFLKSAMLQNAPGNVPGFFFFGEPNS
jgi:DNA-binding transcriptional regulator GbsR (MarR family)